MLKEKEVLAYVVYTPYGDFSYEELYSEEEIQMVRSGEHPAVEGWQNFIILKKDFKLENHT